MAREGLCGSIDRMDDARDRLSPLLLPDETLVWTGRPDPGKHLGPVDVFLVPFGVFWLGFSIFWLVTAVSSGAPFFFPLFGVPFVALGVYFVAGRFLVKAAGKRRTVYGLTEGRALVAEGEGSLQETSLDRTPVDRRRSRGGRHLTVSFGRTSGGWASGPSLANSGMGPFDRGGAPFTFYDVADVEGLEAALRRVREGAAG